MNGEVSKNNNKTNKSIITEIIDKLKASEATIPDILDDEEIVHDLKSSSSHIATFLTKDILKKMVELISIEPPVNSDHKWGHKFPFFACEVLCSQNTLILDMFFSDPIEIPDKQELNEVNKDGLKEHIQEDIHLKKDFNEERVEEKEDTTEINYDEYCQSSEEKPCVENTELMEFLFDSFINQTELNHVLAGYFYKINHHLLYNRREKYLSFIDKHEDRVNSLLKHFKYKSISEIFKQIVSKFDETTEISKKKNMITKVLRLPYEHFLDEGLDSFSDFAIELIVEKRHFNIIAKSPELIKLVYDLVRLKHSQRAELMEIIKVLININEQLIRELGGNVGIDFSYYSNNYEEDQCYPSSAETLDLKSKDMAYIFEYIYEGTKALNDEFNNPNTSISLKPIPSSFGRDILPLGLIKILIVDYFYSLLALIIQFNDTSSDNMNINNLIHLFINSSIFKSIIENYFKFECNNMYQKSFEGIIGLISKKNTSIELVDSLFKETNLLTRLIEKAFTSNFKYKYNQHKRSSNNSINSPLFASICEITYLIGNSENKRVKEYLSESIIVDNNFSIFVKEFVTPIKEKFTKGIEFMKENPFQQKIVSCDEGESQGTWLNKLSLNQLINERKNIYLELWKKEDLKFVPEDCLFYDNSYWNLSNLNEFTDDI